MSASKCEWMAEEHEAGREGSFSQSKMRRNNNADRRRTLDKFRFARALPILRPPRPPRPPPPPPSPKVTDDVFEIVTIRRDATRPPS